MEILDKDLKEKNENIYYNLFRKENPVKENSIEFNKIDLEKLLIHTSLIHNAIGFAIYDIINSYL